MDALPMTVEAQEEETAEGDLLSLFFSLGWAAADEAHLPALPAALAKVLAVPAVRMAVVHWDGRATMEYAYPPPEGRGDNGPRMLYEVEEQLSPEYMLRLSIESVEDLSPGQAQVLNQAARLIHLSLNTILIRQHDRDALGEPFARLSDREWRICLALERPDGEKQIAESLACSRHTVHTYVKSLYRKLQVQSRLQMLDQLKRAREKLRRRALAWFSAKNLKLARREPRTPQPL